MVLLEILGEVNSGGRRNDGSRLASDRELCTLCAGCVPLCPYDALTVHETCLVIDGQKCNACGSCVKGCPTGALKLDVERDAPHFSGGSVRLQGVEAPDLSPGSSGRAERGSR